VSGLNISFKISAIDDFSKTMSSLNKETKKAFDTVGTLGAGMTAAGAGIAIGLGAAVKTTADFESAISRVGALSGATDKDLESLTNTAKDLGATTSFSASQAAEGMSYLAMAGYDTNDIIASMPGLLSAAAAGQTDLATTADITSNILSGFGLQAEETARVADVLTKTFTSSNVDLSMLGETMKYVAPTAKAMGISLEEVAAASGILGNAGIQGSMAGTSLSMSLTRLASPTKEASDLMKQLGFNAFNAEGEMLPLNKIIENLQTSTADLTDEQRMHAISTIFGAESMKSMLTLMEAGPETLSKFTKELETSGGTADEIAQKQLDNLNGQLTILKSGLEAAAIAIGTALLPFIKMLVSGIQSLVDWFNGLAPSVKSTIAVVAALAAGALLLGGPLLMLVGVLPLIAAGFATLTTVIIPFIASILPIIGIVALVIAAIVGIGVGLVVAYKKVEWFRNMVNTAWEAIKTAFNTALTFIKGIVQTVMTTVSAFIGEKLAQIKAFWTENGAMIMQAATNVWNVISTIISTVMNVIWSVMQAIWPVIQFLVMSTWEAIKGVIDGALNVIMGVIKAFAALFTGNWSALWDAIKQIIGGAIQFVWNLISVMFIGKIVGAVKIFASGMKSQITNLWNVIKTVFTASIGAVRNAITTGFNFIKSFVTNTLGTIRSVITSVWNGIKSFISSVINGIKSFITNGFNGMMSTISSVMNSIKSVIQTGWSAAQNFLTSIDLTSIGKNIIQGLVNGIGSMAGSLANKVSEMAGGIKDKIASILGIHSPSRVLMELGEWTTEGFILGIGDNIKGVISAASKLANAATPTVPEPSLAYPNQPVPTSQNRPQVTNNTPVNITLNYNGSASRDDVLMMVDMIDRELANKTDMKMFMRGVKARG